jgi:hypothetical protein
MESTLRFELAEIRRGAMLAKLLDMDATTMRHEDVLLPTLAGGTGGGTL